MRLLIALSIVQAVLLGIIGVRVMVIDARTDKIAAAGTAAAAPLQPAAHRQPAKPFAASSLTADEVRQIIREEIAGISAPAAASHAAPVNKSANAYAGTPSVDLRNSVQRDLNLYVGRGRVGEAEMVDLQTKIAALPPAERRDMMIKLTKLLNDGQLKGQF